MTEKIDYEWKIIHDGQGKTPNIRINSSSFVYKDHLYLVCGASAGLGKSSEVWRYHLGNNEWENCKCNGESPNVRDGHSCSYIGNGKFIVFGGQGFPYPNSKLGKSAESSKVKTYLVRELYNDLYEFNCDNLTWTPIYPDGLNFPMGRRGHVAMFIDSLDCMRSDYKRGNSANIHGPNHYSSDAHSAYDGQSVYSSSTGVATRMSSVKQGSRITANTTADSFDGNLNNAIPGNSLLVFGGSGIELSKYTEQLYNDLWLFSLGTKQWSRHETRGVEPRPMFDHR